MLVFAVRKGSAACVRVLTDAGVDTDVRCSVRRSVARFLPCCCVILSLLPPFALVFHLSLFSINLTVFVQFRFVW